MEQANQKINQEPPLPTKTKIAAVLMSTFGILSLLFSPFLGLVFSMTPGHEVPTWVGFIFFNGFFLCIAALLLLDGFLLPKRRIAWRISIGIVLCLTVISIFLSPFLLPIMVLFIYLLSSHHKKLWKIAAYVGIVLLIFIVVVLVLQFLFPVEVKELTVEELSADWQTYRNEEYGFEIKYPEDWQAGEVFSNPVHPFSIGFEPINKKETMVGTHLFIDISILSSDKFNEIIESYKNAFSELRTTEKLYIDNHLALLVGPGEGSCGVLYIFKDNAPPKGGLSLHDNSFL